VHVNVDASRQNEFAARVEFAFTPHLAAELGDPTARHADVGDAVAAGGDDAAAAEHELERH
jgi:hypothetical protein